MTILRLENLQPNIHESAWIAPSAMVIGKVECAANSSIWYGAVLRGDNDWIRIGESSNVQDGSVLHTDNGKPLTLHRRVLVGHMAMLHGCEIGEGTMVGMGATILNGAKIGKHCLIGARALISENKIIPDGSLVVGIPAKVVRPVTAEEIDHIERAIDHYILQANRHRLAKPIY